MHRSWLFLSHAALMCAVLAAPSPVVKVWPRDAPDALIYEATNGMFAGCEDLVLGGHCHREDVRDTVCAVSCAKQEANDEANNEKLIKTTLCSICKIVSKHFKQSQILF